MTKNEKTPPAASQKGSGAEAGAGEGAVKPKGKKPLLIAVGVLVLVIAGGAGWYFTRGNSTHSDTSKKAPIVKKPEQPRFIPLDPFTVNLQREEGDQFLQVGISLKITDPTLEDKIKSLMPEIRSRLLMLLSGKRASELAPVTGKKKLAQEIISEINGVLGLKSAAAKSPARKIDGVSAASGVAAHPVSAPAAPAPAEEVAEEAAAAEPEPEEISGIQDVLFTSFIIQ